MSGVIIRALEEADLPDTLSLLNGALGNDYIKDSDLSAYAKQGSKIGRIAVGDNGLIVAAVTGILMLPGVRMSELVHADHAERLGKLVPEASFSRVGILKSGAVSPTSRGTGIGTAVSGATTDALFREGASCVVGMAWTDDDGCHAEGMMNRLGFQMRGDIPKLWHQESIDEGYGCPSCGNPCQCTGRIFVHLRHRWTYVPV